MMGFPVMVAWVSLLLLIVTFPLPHHPHPGHCFSVSSMRTVWTEQNIFTEPNQPSSHPLLFLPVNFDFLHRPPAENCAGGVSKEPSRRERGIFNTVLVVQSDRRETTIAVLENVRFKSIYAFHVFPMLSLSQPPPLPPPCLSLVLLSTRTLDGPHHLHRTGCPPILLCFVNFDQDVVRVSRFFCFSFLPIPRSLLSLEMATKRTNQ